MRDLRSAFAEAADPDHAVSQQAYMKSAMPYYGIRTPEMRRICRAVFAAHPLADAPAWEAAVLALWRGAEFREERYAALELLGMRRYRRLFDAPLLTTLETLIVEGAWWDYVDHIAANFVGALLTDHPRVVRPRLVVWSTGDDIWLRRSAILAQLKFKSRTDWPLQQRLMAPSIDSREFFLRKGIGWALREYSKTDPAAVLAYVRDHANVLSGLSRREGLKVLVRTGRIASDDPLLAAPRPSRTDVRAGNRPAR